MRAAELFDLRGRVAAVTGASSGIGREIALALADAGAAVVLVARRDPELQETKRAIEDAGGCAAAVQADLAKRDELREAAVRVSQNFGAPDILVNAAGINARRPLLEVTDEDWDNVMAVNVDAPFFLTQALAAAMLAKGWGRVINIASLQSQRAFPNTAPYGTSKGAIAQLTRAQAQALSPGGVNVNAIAPGFFATELTAPVVADPVRWKKMAESTFIGRNGELADLRGAAIFLASRASDYVTGQVLYVDGGFSAG